MQYQISMALENQYFDCWENSIIIMMTIRGHVRRESTFICLRSLCDENKIKIPTFLDTLAIISVGTPLTLNNEGEHPAAAESKSFSTI